jgi:predicted fused transcriptional regulator/phosphomethylpyrimidine kinase
MGKNTMVRKVVRQQMENNPNLAKLLPHIKGNVGFVFTKGDLKDVRTQLLSNRVSTRTTSARLLWEFRHGNAEFISFFFFSAFAIVGRCPCQGWCRRSLRCHRPRR